MSQGAMLYLAMVLAAAGTFMAVIGFVSVWSRRSQSK